MRSAMPSQRSQEAGGQRGLVEGVAAANKANSDHMAEEEREGLTDFGGRPPRSAPRARVSSPPTRRPCRGVSRSTRTRRTGLNSTAPPEGSDVGG